MGSIFSGVGLVSGMDIQSIVDNLIALESRPRDLLKQRVSNLDAQKAAFLDISARISAMLARVTALKARSSFASINTASSNADALSATATGDAVPGAYSFLVKSLATTQQVVSRGFTSTTAPLGAGTLTLESARARANAKTRLDELNGFAGVQRGTFEIQDAAGTRKTINVADAVTLADVVTKINGAGLNVRAEIRGDHLQLTETTGGALQVREIEEGRTAADLGFGVGHTYSATGSITGTDLMRLSNATPTSALNDGNGLRVGRGGGDFTINGMNVDLSGIMTAGTKLARLNHAGGVELGRIRVTTYNAEDQAVTREIDLSQARTLNDVKTTIEAAGANVSVTITGEKLIVNNTVTTANKRLVIEDVTGHAARDLGIAGEGDTKINGKKVLFNDTMADVLAAINHADASDGSITATLNGTRISLSSAAPMMIASVNGSNSLKDLGIADGWYGGATDGKRVLGGVDSVLLRTLNGGRGVQSGTVNFTVNGVSATADLSTAETLQDAVTALNDAARNAGLAAEIGYDATGTRLVARSLDGVTPVTLSDVSGDFAATFGLNQTAATVRGGNLQRQWISENTLLSSLNSGRGTSTGTIRITNSQGAQHEIDLGSAKSIKDVIRIINDAEAGVTASINGNGDGLLITDTATGSGTMKIADVSGATARDLNILGDATAGAINGSYEVTIDLNAGTSLQEVVTRLNASRGSPVQASILNDGTAVSPYRLQLNARNSGTAGEFLFDAGDTGLDFSTLNRAQDARIVLGGAEGGIMVFSTSNTISNLMPGLSVTLTGTSDEPVTVTVTEDHAAAKTAIDGLVTAFNGAIERIRELGGYDAETEERGILLGDSTANNIESRLLRTMTGFIPGGNSTLRRWGQIGIQVKNGELEFDQAKFDAAYERDPEAVIRLFTQPETGVADTLKKALEEITDSSKGMITRRNKALDSQKEDLTDRITSLNDLLTRKRERLMRQFQAMESALSQMQSQSAALGQIGSLSVPTSARR